MEGIDKHDAKCRGSTRGFFLDRLRQRPGHIFSEVGKVYAVKWNDVLDSVWHLVDKEENYHNVVYNKDLDQPAIVAGRTTLQDFYQLTEDYPVSLTHYVPCPSHSQDDTLYTIKCQILSSSRTFQVACIIFLKTKVELICTWRMLQNAGSCSIIGGRHLKLEPDGNISARSCC
ncbi:hypothetical protein GmHk_03G007238 [Glycine max]|nr:hypothetical protein GmHk_03G007238 [Glycine max]